MRLGIVAHIPPASHGFDPGPFVTNITQFLCHHPLVTFGVDGSGAEVDIEDFSHLITGPKWPCFSNYVFLKAMEIMERLKFTHVIYLEEDCRVGVDRWDERLLWDWNERSVVGGTPAIWNYHKSLLKNPSVRKWIDHYRDETDQRAPLLFNKWSQAQGPENSSIPWLHPIGALALYDLRWLKTVFPGWNQGCGRLASNIGPFDLHIGKHLWNSYGYNQFDHFSLLGSIFSGYKDQNLTLEQRKVGLVNGTFVAVHPIKDRWVVPSRT